MLTLYIIGAILNMIILISMSYYDNKEAEDYPIFIIVFIFALAMSWLFWVYLAMLYIAKKVRE